MSALQLVSLALLATLIGVSQAQCYGRVPLRMVPPPVPVLPPPCYTGPDDLSALLLLAKAVDRPADDVNAGEVINKLVNALVYATTNANAGSAGGAGGAGGVGGSGGSGGSVIPLPTPKPKPKPKPKPSDEREPALIDLGLLTGDDLLNLILAGQDLLRLDLGQGGGTLTKLVDRLV